MKKKAQSFGSWPQTYSRMQSFYPDLSQYPQVDFQQGMAPDAQAIGYVSTEDTDNDGGIDKIHVVVPRFEQELGAKGITGDLEDETNRRNLYLALKEVIEHELGHIKDYDPGDLENPFPGGEGVAEQAARQALSGVSAQATNIRNKLETHISYRSANMLEFLSELNKLASTLDEKQQYKFADQVEEIMAEVNKTAQERGWLGREDFPPKQEADTSGYPEPDEPAGKVREEYLVSQKEASLDLISTMEAAFSFPTQTPFGR